MLPSYLFVIGFTSILAQTVLLRELSVSFYGVELIYTLALGVWLCCSACGTILCRKSPLPNPARLRLLFLVFTLSMPAGIVFVRSIHRISADLPGSYLPLPSQIIFVFLTLLFPGLLLGMLFQWTARMYVSGNKSLAAAYGIESLGGATGGILGTLLLRYGSPNLMAALICALASTFCAFPDLRGKSGRWLRVIASITTALLIGLAWNVSYLDRYMTTWIHPNLIATGDTPYSRVTVTSREGQVSVFENNALALETEGTQTEEFVHLAALQHPHPARVLVVGGALAGTIRELLRHSPESVDYVEQNPAMLKIALPALPEGTRNSLQAANVRVVVEDPRQFIKSAPNYDLILVGMPEPSSAQTNRFFTREFFMQCRSKLKKDGLVAFKLQSSENIWTPQMQQRMGSIHKAAVAVFPDVIFLPGTSNVVLASISQLTKDPEVLVHRLEERRIHGRIVSPSFIRYIYTNDRFDEINKRLLLTQAPVNTDVRPICYQYTVMIWLGKFIPSHLFRPLFFTDIAPKAKLLMLMLPGLAVLLFLPTPWRVRRIVLAAFAGLAGMILETILILHYQTKNGVLFQDIGILLTSFMAGLAAGTLALSRMQRPITRRTGITLLLSFTALSALVALSFHVGSEGSLLQISVLQALTGCLVAGTFAYASLYSDPRQESVVAPLYAADLAGGCAGAILTSIILAPLVGMMWTTFILIPMAVFLILLL